MYKKYKWLWTEIGTRLNTIFCLILLIDWHLQTFKTFYDWAQTELYSVNNRRAENDFSLQKNIYISPCTKKTCKSKNTIFFIFVLYNQWKIIQVYCPLHGLHVVIFVLVDPDSFTSYGSFHILWVYFGNQQ